MRIPMFKNDPALVLILGLITCGLYLIYWNIKAADVLNAAADKKLISPLVGILAGCCYPLHVYYYYLAGQALQIIGNRTNRPYMTDRTTMLLILGIFLPMVSAMIVQGHINELYDESKA